MPRMALVNFFGEYPVYFAWMLPGVEACLLLNSQEPCCAQWRKKACFLRSGDGWPLWFLKSSTNSLLLAAGEPKWHSSSLSARLPSYCDKLNCRSNCICLNYLYSNPELAFMTVRALSVKREGKMLAFWGCNYEGLLLLIQNFCIYSVL